MRRCIYSCFDVCCSCA